MVQREIDNRGGGEGLGTQGNKKTKGKRVSSLMVVLISDMAVLVKV